MKKTAHQVMLEPAFIASYNCLKAPIRAITYGDGHINDTYRVIDGKGSDYILQRINTAVFSHPEQVMQNILKVTEHLNAKGSRSIKVVKTSENKAFYCDASNNYWRLYAFINGKSPSNLCSLEVLNSAGEGFGSFLTQMNDFPLQELYETIPLFHHTPTRLMQLREAYLKDERQRAKEVRIEYEFAMQFAKEVSMIVDAMTSGEIPVRVTHNDTKVNNVLLDVITNKVICLVDLDTLMPGSALYDYGDGIRSSITLAAEDEGDLSKVGIDLARFEAFTSGFLAGAGGVLTPREVELLPMGAVLMTLECGMRFLADYLSGDCYFKTQSEDHNLRRARTQFKLVQEMMFNYEALTRIVTHCL